MDFASAQSGIERRCGAPAMRSVLGMSLVEEPYAAEVAWRSFKHVEPESPLMRSNGLGRVVGHGSGIV